MNAPAQRERRPRGAYPRRDIYPGGTYKREHKKQWVKGSRVARRTGEGPWLPERMGGETQEEKDACLECVLPDCTEPVEGCAWTRVRAAKRAKS
jgi:hypothetical protein